MSHATQDVVRYNREVHHRRSIRLRHYDYRQAGAYFVAVCVEDRACLLGRIVDGEMRLNDYGRGVRQEGWAPFRARLWQRNYYEHVIRNEVDLLRIREYIEANPARWELDQLNPDNPSKW